MLKSIFKSCALAGFFIVLSVSASFGDQIVLVPDNETVTVGEAIAFDVQLQSDDPISALLVQFQLEGATVSSPEFTTDGTVWAQASTGSEPVSDVQMEDGIVTIQSSLIGKEAIFGSVEAQSIGTLNFTAESAGTLTVSLLNARVFDQGFVEPQGLDKTIDAEPISVEVTAGPEVLPGDLNADDFRDASDINLLLDLVVDFIFGNPIPPAQMEIANVAPRDNPDNILDAQDINVLLDLIIEDLLGGKVVQPEPQVAAKTSGRSFLASIPLVGDYFEDGQAVPLVADELNIDSVEVPVGEAFSVDFNAVGVSEAETFTLRVEYDETAIQSIESVSKDGGLADEWPSFIVVTDNPGVIAIIATNRDTSNPSAPAAPVINGDGRLFTVNAVAADTSGVDTQFTIPLNSGGLEGATVNGGSVSVIGAEVPTPTPPPANSPTNTPLPEATFTPTNTPTSEPVATNTPTEETPTATPVNTPTEEPEATDTPEPEATPTNTPEPEATSTPTEEPEATDTPEPEATPTNTPEPEATSTPTEEPEATDTPEPEVTSTPTNTPEVEVTSTPTFTPTPTPTTEVELTPTMTSTPTPTPAPLTPTPIPVQVVDNNSGLIVLSMLNWYLDRGTQSGSLENLGVSNPMDVEVVNNTLLTMTSNGMVYPENMRKASNGGAPLGEFGTYIDIEPVGPNAEGYLVMDHFGRIHAFGSAEHQGHTVFTQSMALGRIQLEQPVANSIDLEVVNDPNAPGVNLGYYVLTIDGDIHEFGAVPELPDIQLNPDLGQYVAMELLYAGNDVIGYRAMSYRGQVFTYTASDGFSVPTAAERVYGEPFIVDFATDGDDIYVLDANGVIYGPGGINNDPDNFNNRIGDKNLFLDLEVGNVMND